MTGDRSRSAPAVPPTGLPVEAVLPELVTTLDASGRAVLQAPPGAGKTTLVPLALLQHRGRIVLLEPRRLAARAAAERMAAMLGEPVGSTVGYRMRGDTRVSSRTRIEVVTEGVLTRMLLSDPALDGVDTVIFDEFHERSLNADVGLALTWEARSALRPDLRILVMSATLETGPVAALLDDAPVLTAEGRAHPVETLWQNTPVRRDEPLDRLVAARVREALSETEGGVLVFLPGAAEIRRVAQRLADLPDAVVRPLYGALPATAQRAAIAPSDGPRKIVLATSIAETSLTIEDVRVVVDSGLTRRQRFDPGSGMARLVTERVSRAEADQRRGRAGRVAPGRCYRLWMAAEEGALPGHPPPEIAVADLTRLALDLAIWGDRDGSGMALLTPPPAAGLAAARAVLGDLDMIDAEGGPTAHGRAAADLPLHPRLAHMLMTGGAGAAPLAALLAAPGQPGADIDLERRLARPLPAEIRAEARRLARSAPDRERPGIGAMVALAYPDRIGLRRPGDGARYLTAGGKGAILPAESPLAGLCLLAIAETDGHPREARIRSAAAITESELRALFPDRIVERNDCRWSSRERRVVAARRECFAALVLAERPWIDPPDAMVAGAMLDGIRQIGLPWSDGARRLAARVAWARRGGEALPDMTEAALLADPDGWLTPWIAGIRTAQAWQGFDLVAPLEAMLGHGGRRRLDAIAPAVFTTPLGRRVAIEYGEDGPEIAVRLQELFGVSEHPRAAGLPIRITLLSPAGRPVQVTSDIAGFWAVSYADVRRDMRGRYPRHPWPEDPAAAAPTTRSKRRR